MNNNIIEKNGVKIYIEDNFSYVRVSELCISIEKKKSLIKWIEGKKTPVLYYRRTPKKSAQILTHKIIKPKIVLDAIYLKDYENWRKEND